MWTFVFMFLLLVNLPVEAQINSGSTVTIPLDDYLKLIKQEESEHRFTSAEELKITGEYGEQLKMSINGRASKKPVSVEFMLANNEYHLSNCVGSATIAMLDGNFSLLPSERSFRVSCDVNVLNWQQPVEFTFKNVISPQVMIKGAEAILQSEKGALLHTLFAPAKLGQLQLQALPRQLSPIIECS